MVAINTFRPLDFSAFADCHGFATGPERGLHPYCLSRGRRHDAAGLVIEAFGEFVISGNFAVGIFVFIILIIINLVVITRGAGRVSEVSARFTLDAMPGKRWPLTPI